MTQAVRKFEEDLAYVEHHIEVLRNIVESDNATYKDHIGTLAFALECLKVQRQNMKHILRRIGA